MFSLQSNSTEKPTKTLAKQIEFYSQTIRFISVEFVSTMLSNTQNNNLFVNILCTAGKVLMY